MTNEERLAIAHEFADMVNRIEIHTDGADFETCLHADAVRQIREWTWALINSNQTEDLVSVRQYMKAFESAVTESLPFIHTETAEDNQRDKNEMKLQAIALILNALKLITKSKEQ